MPVKTFNPKTPSMRNRVVILKPGKEKNPLKDKVLPLKQKSGRSFGKISVRRRGGGHKRKFRLLNFNDNRNFYVKSIEYDPNRSGLIARVIFSDNTSGYVLASSSLKVGDTCKNFSNQEKVDLVFKENTLLQLSQVPIGTNIYSIESKENKGGTYCRAAGTASRVIFKTKKFVQVLLPSGERKWFSSFCKAILGSVSQPDWNKRVIGKAGASRWASKRPRVRGVAMNPKDHPHGGGTGRRSGGRPSVTPWGRLTKGGSPTSKRRKRL